MKIIQKIIYFNILIFALICFNSCKNNENIIENEGFIEKQEIINIEDYISCKEEVAFKTGFVKDEKGITYIDDGGSRILDRCIKK